MDWMWPVAANATWKCCFCVFYRRRTKIFSFHLCSLLSHQTLQKKTVSWRQGTQRWCSSLGCCFTLWRWLFNAHILIYRIGAGPWEGQLKWTRSMQLPCMCLRAARCCSVTPETPEPSQSSASCCHFSASPCRAWFAVSAYAIVILLWL